MASTNTAVQRPRKTGRVIFTLRLIAALLVLALFIYAYLAPGMSFNGLLSLLAKTQFSAALYGYGILCAVVLVNLALALFAGRWYCALLCPLGTLQELVWRLGVLFRRGKKDGAKNPGGLFRVSYARVTRLRYLLFVPVALGIVFAFTPLMIALDPISIFGRGLGFLRQALSGMVSPFALFLALPLAVILGMAIFQGRAFCAICPVGMSLGLLSSLSPLSFRFKGRCVSCGICEKKCPAFCIDAKAKTIDRSRCVSCSSCAASCPQGGISFGTTLSGSDRRGFLKSSVSSLACGALYLFGANLGRPVQGLFKGGKDRASSPDSPGHLILPPGAKDLNHYAARCTGCQTCAASCPVGIIQTRSDPHPALVYEDAACQYNCTECGRVCPTGAIRFLDAEDKRRTRIALSALSFANCVVNTKGEACGACAEVCPTHALIMEPYPQPGKPLLTRPVFDEHYCIGCGACLVACPASPKALTITAVTQQTLTAGMRPAAEDDENSEGNNIFQMEDDFPF